MKTLPVLFKSVPVPMRQREYRVGRTSKWYTWSPELRVFLSEWCKKVRKTRYVKRVYLSNRKYYHDTYSLKPKFINNTKLRKQLDSIADSFYKLKYSKNSIFFTNMIDGSITENGLHCFFACLREILIKKFNDRFSAMYSPIYTRETYEKDFPLHSDIFIPKILLMLFVQVPKGRTGGTFLLSVEDLKKIFSKIKLLPKEKRKLVLRILKETNRNNDRYDEFFYILHDEDNPWNKELQKLMNRKREYIKLESGQGYLIHDRLWLHGRKRSKSKITIKRLQRFVFNTKQTLEI
ncbi:hypothetical protein [Candidatus Nitrosotenuis cloacae]|uniref:hypothetical protein n=1 Tax=Candidatus Nitrosotenuis cloacae TaxID=1603555 RepID=UPI00227E1DBE|nr:hypothetical protein [Candidatus Nitrosotenuis cloacae]